MTVLAARVCAQDLSGELLNSQEGPCLWADE